MKKIVLLCILLSSLAMARFDCCARKRATVKKEETSLTFSVGVVRAEDESLLKKASSSLAKESITLQIKKWDNNLFNGPKGFKFNKRFLKRKGIT